MPGNKFKNKSTKSKTGFIYYLFIFNLANLKEPIAFWERGGIKKRKRKVNGKFV